jgi:hypothetical protein
MWSWSAPADAQSVTWQILPFPQIDWGGLQGQPATTNGNLVTLQGQPVRTVQSFSGPLRISYDVLVDSRISTDGGLQLFFVPTGLSSNLISPSMQFYFGYRNRSDEFDALFIQIVSSNGAGTRVWGDVPFSISAQTVYHHTIDVSATGELTWIVNNLTNSIPSTVKMPYEQFQLELQGWQPGGPTWSVSNFTVVPEPNAATLVALGLVSILFFVRGRRSKGTCSKS